jgi:hypothetical protein
MTINLLNIGITKGGSMNVASIVSSIVAYVTSNWADIVAIYLSIIGAASIIVKLTPTLRDDDVLKGIIRFLGKYIALNRSSTPNA